MAAKDQAQPQQVAVSRRQMVDEILGKLGAQGSLLFWEFLCEMRNEDGADAEMWRSMKESYLRGGESKCGDVSVAVIFAMVKSWESDPAVPVFNLFFGALREYTVFRMALKCAELPNWADEDSRRKVVDAVRVLRELFAGTFMELKISDLVN
jgi:hypothetical protein